MSARFPPGHGSRGAANAILFRSGAASTGAEADCVLEPTVEEVEALIRAIPYGETRTVKDLRLDLADARGVAAVCAVTTGQHLRRIAKAVSESVAVGVSMDDAVPVWRVVDESSPLLHRSSSPAKPLASRRRSETPTGVR